MPRPKKLGPAVRTKFLNLIRKGVEAQVAAEECGFTRGRFYQLRLENEFFRAEWLAAEQEYLLTIKEKFLDVLATTGDVNAAAEAVNMRRRLLYKWRARDHEFAHDWQAAVFEYDDAVVKGAMLQELAAGYSEQVVIQRPIKDDSGKTIGWQDHERVAKKVSRPADKLTYLKAHHPEFSTQVTGAFRTPMAVTTEASDQLLDEVIGLLENQIEAIEGESSPVDDRSDRATEIEPPE